MKNEIFLQDEFGAFMNEFKSKNKNDYYNYVKNADEILSNKLFTIIEEIIINNDFNQLAVLRINGGYQIKNSNKTSKNQYASGFSKYLDFIEEHISTTTESVVSDFDKEEDITISVEEIDIEPDYNKKSEFPILNSSTTFFKNEVFNNFTFRLITQNRFNKCGLFFPISFLKQYFYKTGDKEYFDAIIENQIKGIEYITRNSDNNTLNNMKELVIKENGEVFIDGKQILSYNIKDEKNSDMIVKSLSEISIDHKESMNSILIELHEKKELPNFTLISKHLKKGLHKPISYNKLRSRGTQLSKDENFINLVNKEELKLEFEKVLSRMGLQLMHKKHNNFKRAR